MLEVTNFKGNCPYKYSYGTEERKEDMLKVVKYIMDRRNENGKTKESNND